MNDDIKTLLNAVGEEIDPMKQVEAIAGINSDEELVELQRLLDEIKSNGKLSNFVRFDIWSHVFEVSNNCARGLGILSGVKKPEKLKVFQVTTGRFNLLVDSGVQVQMQSPSDGDWMNLNGTVQPPEGAILRFLHVPHPPLHPEPLQLVEGVDQYKYLSLVDNIINLEPQYPK